MTKDLHQAIMKRSKLRNKFLKSRNLSDRKNYTSHRNLCKKLLKNTKRTYFNNFDIKKVTDNRKSWKTVVPVFSNKFSKIKKINLTDGNKTISNKKELCRVFNNFFSKTVDELKIPNISDDKLDNTNDALKEVLRYFENHPSITNIKSESCDTNFTFYVIPVHKKEIKSDKVNYRPVSILPSLSKTYEKLMYQQLYEHFNSILSPNQCGFRKGYSTQHCLMIMLKKFKESRNKREEFGPFFIDLSEAFDCIDHNLLITKLSRYGVTPISM